MRQLKCKTVYWLLFCSLLFGAAVSQGASLKAAQVNLFSNYTQINASQPALMLFQIKLLPGWHVYWRNPGESGLAPKLKFDLPQGVQAGPIIWQPPQRLLYDTLLNYGYSGTASFLVPLTFNANSISKQTDKTLSLKLKADWLVCKTICLPQSKELTYRFNVGANNIASSKESEIKQLLRSSQLSKLAAEVKSLSKNKIELIIKSQLNAPKLNQVKDVYFFPNSSAFETQVKQSWKKQDQTWQLVLSYIGALPKQVVGDLLVIDQQNKRHYWRVAAPNTASINASSKSKSESIETYAQSYSNKTHHYNALVLLCFAFLGGIILNIMPCVFPILSLKVIGLTQHHETDNNQIKLQGIFYTLGVVGSLLVLGGILVSLKFLGHAIGWGYQLQSPVMISFLIVLFFLIGLNLSGLYDIKLPGLNFSSHQSSSLSSHFFTGVLATLVATPCSAPFMATALGVALVSPSLVSLGIFIALGLGLAFPYLLLCFIPALAHCLPKPGQWMNTMKEFLAFPMYLTVVWLLFVFVNQVGILNLFLLVIALVMLVFSIWLFQIIASSSRGVKLVILILSVLLVLLPWYYALYTRSETKTAVNNVEKLNTQSYSTAGLEQLLGAGKAVFVYATADWCITCKVNERTTLNTQAIQHYFKEHNITVLKADWTKQDPQITHFLERFERSTVPLYVYFPANHGEPKILPQLLTPAIMKEYLS